MTNILFSLIYVFTNNIMSLCMCAYVLYNVMYVRELHWLDYAGKHMMNSWPLSNDHGKWDDGVSCALRRWQTTVLPWLDDPVMPRGKSSFPQVLFQFFLCPQSDLSSPRMRESTYHLRSPQLCSLDPAGLGALIGHLKKTVKDHTKRNEENKVVTPLYKQ